MIGGGAEELVSDGVPDVFIAIFEGRASVQTWEGLNCVVEVSMAEIVGNTEVKLF